MSIRLGPRLVVAGTHSGAGKTTVATGLMAALRRRGAAVASAKVGPDYIDPGYHSVATGRPGRNLDAWMCGRDAIGPLAGRAAAQGDLLVVEGVMGLFDGAAGPGGPEGLAVASTAEAAVLLDAPILLVVDAASLSASVAAIVHGFATFHTGVTIGGVVLNRVGSDGHEAMLREAMAPTGVPVLGVLRRDDAFAWRDRHLGLVPVVEHPDAVSQSVNRLADAITVGCDLEAIVAMARAAAEQSVEPVALPRRTGSPVIAVASGPAFSFSYRDNLEALEAAGAELVPFDAMNDPALPSGATGVVAGGGFPEVFAPALAANRPLLVDVASKVAGGLVTWAECGGLLWLARSLDGHALAGAVPADGRMGERLTLGYRTATTLADSPLGPEGTMLRGHEFHYSVLDPPGDGLTLEGRLGSGVGGWLTPTLFASYLHTHLGAAPELAERFVAAASR